jgi:2-amino-4-hydroxy-6-hydroxymethyldihydropteridine diphosphokinase
VDRVTIVAVAIGSNLGDRHAHLQFAFAQLERLLTGLTISSLYETAPVGVTSFPGPQGDFLNAAAVGETRLEPEALLEALLAIEDARGRERPFPGAARTLDLDLILFADRVIDRAGLRVPHPRFRERAFVLQPLAEIAPNLGDPVTGRTVGQLWTAFTLPTRAAEVPRR